MSIKEDEQKKMMEEDDGSMRYYVTLVTGDKMYITATDFGMLKRYIERLANIGVVLQNGDILKTTAVLLLGREKTTKVKGPKA